MTRRADIQLREVRAIARELVTFNAAHVIERVRFSASSVRRRLEDLEYEGTLERLHRSDPAAMPGSGRGRSRTTYRYWQTNEGSR